MNDAFVRGMQQERGMGEVLGLTLEEAPSLANPELSLLLAARQLGVPLTVHAALGAEIIHQHPAASGAAIGDTSHRDFRRLAHSLISDRRRRRRAQPRQRGDHARGIPQGAHHRAQPRRRQAAELHDGRSRHAAPLPAARERGPAPDAGKRQGLRDHGAPRDHGAVAGLGGGGGDGAACCEPFAASLRAPSSGRVCRRRTRPLWGAAGFGTCLTNAHAWRCAMACPGHRPESQATRAAHAPHEAERRSERPPSAPAAIQ